MHIDHLAIWTRDLEATKDFYVKYFNMKCNNKYVNEKKHFSSYFLSLGESSTRIELMSRNDIVETEADASISFGLTHFCISLGSKEKVDELTERLRSDGYPIIGETRTSGDGYYESVILDNEGNRVELSI